MGLAKIRMGFLDDRSGFGKPRRRLPGDVGDFGINRGDAEIGRIGNAFRCPARARGREERNRQRGQRQWIGRMLAAHRIQQQGKVLDVARHRALHAESTVNLGDRRMRNAADARSHADHAAEARGITQRSAHVRAMREPGHTGRERDRCTARRAGGGERSIPRVSRRPEDFVESIGASAEFRRVRLGVDQPAVMFEMFDQNIGTRRDVIPVDR